MSDTLTYEFPYLIPAADGHSSPELRQVTVYRKGNQIVSSEGDFVIEINPSVPYYEKDIQLLNLLNFIRAAKTLVAIEPETES